MEAERCWYCGIYSKDLKNMGPEEGTDEAFACSECRKRLGYIGKEP